jgi:hypothetical protein
MLHCATENRRRRQTAFNAPCLPYNLSLVLAVGLLLTGAFASPSHAQERDTADATLCRRISR